MKRGTVFYKMSGSGNDFIMLDGRHSRLEQWPAEKIVAICDRRMGAGADGFVILTPTSVPGEIRFEFLNKDGSVKGTEVFISGFQENNSYVGRPVDVLFLKDGSMLISDDFNGAVWRVTYGDQKSAAKK